jgi:hypothetical protein
LVEPALCVALASLLSWQPILPSIPLVCRRNAEKFSAERFRQEFDALVQLRWAEFQASLGARA